MSPSAKANRVKPKITVPTQTQGIRDGHLEWFEGFEGIRSEEVGILKVFITDFNEFAPDALSAIWYLQQKIMKKKGLDDAEAGAVFSPNVIFYRDVFKIIMDTDGLVSIYYEDEDDREDKDMLLGALYIDVVERCGGEILKDSKERMKNNPDRDKWKKGLE